ncbi:MAG TPA: PDZ domain-containing protein [Pseudolysinimonas sp.]|nr:PDZ domain-containing protein [Pseudolysinimonas sp.]
MPRFSARSSRAFVGWVLLVGAVGGTVIVGSQPAPFVIEQPGPVYDTLGSVEIDGVKKPLIAIPGEKTYPTTGKLDMLTVNLVGSRQLPLTWFDLATAWFDPKRSVVPIDAVYPPDQTDKEADEEGSLEMETSQKAAIGAALTELDIPFQSVVSVGAVVAGQPAEGVLKAGDVILSVAGHEVHTPKDVQDRIVAGGVGAPLTVVVRRGDSEKALQLTPVASKDDPARAVIGIYPVADYDFPIDVRITLDRVGGPSAGQMFALAIYDKLTPGALVKGAHIAGTGTITADGTVGAIGGIRQKMYGAAADGAAWFLAPAANCNEVVGHIPAGLTVFATKNLDDSLAIVRTIAAGDDTSQLPTCQ